MVTDPAEVRRLAEAKRAENLGFRRYLEAHHRPTHHFHVLAAEVEVAIDCKQCANCCREMTVDVSPGEVAALAAHLGTTESEVARLYTARDPGDSEQLILRSDGEGCVFLDGKLCMVYDARPEACRRFPHATSARTSLGSRLASVCEHSSICPILYNALEEFKRIEGYPARTRRAAGL